MLIKPRICEILGVEVGERFRFMTPHKLYEAAFVASDGILYNDKRQSAYADKVCGESVCWLINHQNVIQRLPPEPCLTESELAICKAVGAKWVSRDEFGGHVDLWAYKPKQMDGYNGVLYSKSDLLASIKVDLFPNVHPRDCIEVPE